MSGAGPAGEDRPATVRRLAAHPYLLSSDLDDASDATRLTGPLSVDDVLDLTFGTADALVEVHRAGLTHGAIGPSALLALGSGEHRMTGPAADPVPGSSPAADVAALGAAMLALLPDRSATSDDARGPATRDVLQRAAAGDVPDAASLRDAVAAIRLGAESLAHRREGAAPVLGDRTAAATTSSGTGDHTGVRDVGPTDGPVLPSSDRPGYRRGPSGLLIGVLIAVVVLSVLLVLLVSNAPF